MNKILLIFLSVFIISLIACTNKTIKVACVGDSITEGYGLKMASKTGYPVILDSILGLEYTVLNSGRSGTTALKNGNFPYWTCKEISNTFVFKPDIIVIKLGTNDTKPNNWNAEEFEKDYQTLIDTFKTISSNPKIYLCMPVPVFNTRWGIKDSTIVNGVIPIVSKLAESNNLPLIDLYNTMSDQGANFPDDIHPNETAVKAMAEIVASAIK